MISEGLEGVGFVAINTDAQDLATNLADNKINI
jgi:cell division GTPase FtsZ